MKKASIIAIIGAMIISLMGCSYVDNVNNKLDELNLALSNSDKSMDNTSDSIGQVASQTMHSLACTNEVCTIPVYRPCIGLDKLEIINISEKIGTYETSILPFEDCCTIFVAKHPVTKPNLAVIKKHEHHLDDVIDDLMKTALETKETMVVKVE